MADRRPLKFIIFFETLFYVLTSIILWKKGLLGNQSLPSPMLGAASFFKDLRSNRGRMSVRIDSLYGCTTSTTYVAATGSLTTSKLVLAKDDSSRRFEITYSSQ